MREKELKKQIGWLLRDKYSGTINDKLGKDIIRLKNQGIHAYELAYLFGVTANAIYARIRKHKLRYSGGGQRGTGTRNYLYGMAGAGGCGGQAGE